MHKKLLTIILTALLFFSAVALGSATVFRVDEVAVVATVVSEEATTDVAELQNVLLNYQNVTIYMLIHMQK